MLERALEGRWAHVCVDMQSLFAEETDWHAPWLRRVLPQVEALVARSASRTIFTRFLPPLTAGHARGAWRDYYRRWPRMVRDRLDPALLDIVPALARFVPPARLFDKAVYSPWFSGALHQALQADGVRSLVVSGGETDVCVLATVLGAIDLGYRVVLPRDALFGSSDATHDAVLGIYGNRFQSHLTVASVAEVLDVWERMS